MTCPAAAGFASLGRACEGRVNKRGIGCQHAVARQRFARASALAEPWPQIGHHLRQARRGRAGGQQGGKVRRCIARAGGQQGGKVKRCIVRAGVEKS